LAIGPLQALREQRWGCTPAAGGRPEAVCNRPEPCAATIRVDSVVAPSDKDSEFIGHKILPTCAALFCSYLG
jgi:hypothetical protein